MNSPDTPTSATPADIWTTTPPDRPGLWWIWFEDEEKPPVWPDLFIGERPPFKVLSRMGERCLSEFPAGTRFCPVDPPGAVQAERGRIAQYLEERAKQADATNDDLWPERGIDAGDQLRLAAEAVRRGAPA